MNSEDKIYNLHNFIFKKVTFHLNLPFIMYTYLVGFLY